MGRILFYATGHDIKPVLRRVEDRAPLKFIPTGKRAEPNRPIHLQSSQIPDVGVATRETGSASTRYMVSLRDTKNVLYKFKGNTGEWRWHLSNGDNADTILLTIAGLWKTGTLLPGEVCTLHDTTIAQQLMGWFFSAFQEEHFTKIDVWWLGREALAMLKNGRRLTQADQSPPESDLRLPADLQ